MKRPNFVIMIIRLLLALACIGAIASGIQIRLMDNESMGSYFLTAFTALLSIAITYIPDFLAHKDIMVMPAALQTFFALFTFLAMFFGEILNFYDRFFWWDSMLHFTSGLMFAMIGFMLFISLNRDSGVRRRLNPISVVLFAVFFSIACGAGWEIFEFMGDSLFGMNMQRWQSNIPMEEWAAMQNVSNLSNPGLIDTMKDIVNDTVSSILSIVVLLPLIKRDSKYVKTSITYNELLEEGRKLVPETRIKQSPASTAEASDHNASENIDVPTNK